MLKITGPYLNRQNITVTGSVWRWVRLEVDAVRLTATVVLFGYADLATAQAAGTPSAPTYFERKSYVVSGAALGVLIGTDAAGANLSDRISAAIYAHVRSADPLFAGAEDVGL